MLGLGAALLCAALAPAANAATAVNRSGTLTYTGAPGAGENFQVRDYPGGVLVYRLTSAEGCTLTDALNQGYFCPGVQAVVADLGDGDDLAFLLGGPRVVLDAGPGDDVINVLRTPTQTTIRGGSGIDQLVSRGSSDVTQSLTLDSAFEGVVGDSPFRIVDGVEELLVGSGPAILTGDAGPNTLTGGDYADRITGGAGSDVLVGNGGDDTLDARDGELDRVRCGDGNDIALVDSADQVAEGCEDVQVTATAVPSVQDLPPQLTWRAGSALTVDATDDRGVAEVRFSAGETVLCTVKAAPFVCRFTPGIADVGRKTIVAVASDTAGQTSTAIRTLVVPKFTPRAVSLTVKRQGKRFVASGKVTLPNGIPCSGTVTVKAGTTTRTAKLGRSCAYRVVSLKGGRVVATYGGTDAITAKRSPVRTVR
ncbi:hypothetical protein OJ997_21875 [Solirubrobacter phytolaccae]|uniref:Calcium-binding protein n=1 Tax=Solirubrobacter phytolaccae TaxID=1404360 RepID=A0A9X3S946_9ACTN|nr:hypothetical protein [Solirubrobacter phytolaccae]MDA0182974.1 hypothetical protein [Solirubrobacter phytolaccae]